MTCWKKIVSSVLISLSFIILSACASDDQRGDINPSDSGSDDTATETDTGENPDGGTDGGSN